MKITHKIQMDLTQQAFPPRIDVAQDDMYTRNLELSLLENNRTWLIPEGTTAIICYQKPDGTKGNYDVLPDGTVAYTIRDNVLTVALAPQVCTSPGTVKLAVRLLNQNAVIHTFMVEIHVRPTPGLKGGSRDYHKIMGLLPASGWEPNMYLGTDENGNITVKSGPGNTPVVVYHSISWNLLHISSSSTMTEVRDGDSITAVLSAHNGYTLDALTVTMDGRVLTGVWNADTATLTIAQVTGDVIISCAGTEIVFSDTTPVIEVYGKGITSAGRVYANENWGYTKYYPINDTRITLYATNTQSIAGPTSNAIMTALLNSDDGTAPFTNVLVSYVNPLSEANRGKVNDYDIPAGTTGLRATILLAEIENYFIFETNTKKVIFAGRNTPYYGMAYVKERAVETGELSYDDDVAQNYAVSTASILGDEPEVDTATAYGVSDALAECITAVKKEWMAKYGGDYRKIPIIVSADQHGRTNEGLFNLLGKTASMYDVSKVINLGDTISEWVDRDIEHPLLSNSALEKWCKSVQAIPFSKQLNVYGNHDTWYGNHADAGNPIGTRYPSSQAHLNQYFRNIYARRTNNNGWFVVRDDQFNVKYVVISGFEYQGNVTFRIGTAQMKFIIDELTANDGYDVVLISHVPLRYKSEEMTFPTGYAYTTAEDYRVSNVNTDELFAARKNKTSGSVTDSDGVTHNFDFSGCTTDVLCALHGHTHHDAYIHVGGKLLSYSFDWFDGNTIHFVLLDRVNRQMSIWKVEGDSLTCQNHRVPLDPTNH